MSDVITSFAPGDAAANLLAGAKQMTECENQRRIAAYKVAFANWQISVMAGRISNAQPPAVPVKVVLAPPDEFGFVLGYVETTEPVCDPLPVPPDFFTPKPVTPNHIHVGAHIFGAWYAVPEDDTFGVGKQTPPIVADGETAPAIFERYGAAVGRGGWYLKVS